MSQSLPEVATFSEHTEAGAPFHLTDHPSARVGRAIVFANRVMAMLMSLRFFRLFLYIWSFRNLIDKNLRASGQVRFNDIPRAFR